MSMKVPTNMVYVCVGVCVGVCELVGVDSS